MKSLPIGVFDSGLGGLTALAELHKLLPNEDIIYFGDNARIPYGTKSPEIIKKFALQDTRFLLSKGVKAILVACGTVSSNCLKEVSETAKIPVVGVITAAAESAYNIAKDANGAVAVLGTSATINSGAYECKLKQLGAKEIINCPCPMFVPLVENWHPDVDDVAANAIVSEYISPIADKSPAAAILGCTHYPLLAPVIQKYLPQTQLISSGAAAAYELKERLTNNNLLNEKGGNISYYTSGGEKLFCQNATKFLKTLSVKKAEHIDIEEY